MMKKITFFLTFILSAIFAVSCSDDDNPAFNLPEGIYSVLDYDGNVIDSNLYSCQLKLHKDSLIYKSSGHVDEGFLEITGYYIIVHNGEHFILKDPGAKQEEVCFIESQKISKNEFQLIFPPLSQQGDKETHYSKIKRIQ